MKLLPANLRQECLRQKIQLTLEGHIFALVNEPCWRWTARWFTLGRVLVDSGKSVCQLGASAPAPVHVTALGACGLSVSGAQRWVGWDLDIGHGKNPNATVREALDAAHRIIRVVRSKRPEYPYEIRHSKGGRGVHVRVQVNDCAPEKARAAAHAIAAQAGAKCCSICQPHWLWAEEHADDGFMLVEEGGFREVCR